MGTDDPAIEQRRPRAGDGLDAERFVRLRGVLRAARALGDRWRSRFLGIVSALVSSLRAAGLYYLRGGGSSGEDRALARRPVTEVRTLTSSQDHGPHRPAESPPSPTGPVRDGPSDRGQTERRPGPAERRRQLPSGDGRLQVERTAERLTLSDPDAEEAYLSSTVWVDIEE